MQDGHQAPESNAAFRGGGRRPTAGRILVVVAAVLLAGFGFVILGTRPVATWEVLEIRDPTRVHLSHGRFRARGPQVGESMEPTWIATDRLSEVALRLGDLLALRMPPNAALHLPPPPARWIGRHRRLVVQGGEVAFTSWDRALGDRLVIDAGVFSVRLEGADLVVRRHPDLTEVHLLHGAVELTTSGGDVHRLEGLVGMRFAGEAPPVTIPMDARARELVEALPRAE